MITIALRIGFACSAALLAASVLTAPAHAGSANAAVTDTPAAKTRTLGFALTSLSFDIYKGANDCPDGMAMAANEIEALIKAAIPDARVTVEDLAGDGDHYAATVVSEAFRGIPRVKQHQIVYAALRGRMGGELHALALQTSAPE